MSLKPYALKRISIGVLYIVLIFKLTGPANSSEASTPDKEPNNQINIANSTRPNDIQLNRNCVLCGFISDAKTGKPVTDATVNIEHRYKAETDASGFYCLDKIFKDGNYRISIDSNKYVGIYDYEKMPIVNLSGDKQVVKDFKLDKGCIIEVRVVNEANQPIEGAELSVTSHSDERYREIGGRRGHRRTDKDGICLLGGIPPSPTGYLITATSSTTTILHRRKDGLGVVQKQWDYAPGMLTIILNDTETSEFGQIILQKGIEVNGCVKYEDGIPASDLSIYAYPDWWSSNSCPEKVPIDANGFFTLRHIVPGIYRLMANIPKGHGGSIGIPVLHTRLPLPDNELLILKIPQKSPQSLASIKGKFLFKNDKVPHYVDISASSINGKYHSSAMWNNYNRDPCDMNFVIDRLEPGKYKLTFRGQNVEEKIIEDVEAPGESLEVEIATVEKPIIKGTVINSQTSRPIQCFRARARKIRTLRGANYRQSDQWLEFDDTGGRFNIEAVGPGIYQIQIAADGFAWTLSDNFNTDSNEPVVIKLSSGGCIKGRVVNEAGQLINGAKVIPLSKAAGEKAGLRFYTKNPFISEDGAVETVDGSFELKNLASGNESIKVLHPDYTYSIINNIEIREGQTTEGIEVVLNRGGSVEGYVLDAQGQPQPNITLHFQNEGSYRGITEEKAGRLAVVTTDANGYYRVGGLPEKLCYVKRQTERQGMGVICRTIVPANGKVSRLDFGGQPNVMGRIIIDGVPIANRRIILSATDGRHSSTFRYYAMTEPDGRFIFGGIPKGKWRIYCEDTEQRNIWIIIAVFELTDRYIDLGLIPSGISTVHVSIEYMEGTPKWDIAKAYLQEDDKPWGEQIAQLDKSPDENGTYVAKYILPGEHFLVLIRKDYTMLRQSIEVTKNDVNIIVRIPKCASGIYGRLTGKALYGLTVWRKDKTVVGHIKPDEKGNYKLDNLPAGEYLAGGNMLIEKGTLLEFELAEGEQKNLDVDVPDISETETGSLQVMVVDENGVPLTAVSTWLEGSTGPIEPIINSGQQIYFVTKPGKYMLHASFTGYKEVRQAVSIETFDLKKNMRQPSPVLLRLDKVEPGQ